MVKPELFIRRGALGDTLLTVPQLPAVRRGDAAELHFAGVPEFGELLRRFGVVDQP